MEDLSFGEQVKIILSRKKMTIKQLAELIELQTGQKMSRQNLTQRLGRDNFQEKDMRMIAGILGCPFTLNIISGNETPAKLPIEIKKAPKSETEAIDETASNERDMTIGEIYEIHEELEQLEEPEELEVPEPSEKIEALEKPEEPEIAKSPTPDEAEATTKESKISNPLKALKNNLLGKTHEKRVRTPKDPDFEPVIKLDDLEEDLEKGEVNPYTGREYLTNSVRVHPNRIGYVQVYDRADHKWTDMTEWAFLGYQERKKALLGKDYDPPIYLD